MNEIRNVGCVRYYCTAGNGMEPFLVDEVKRKLSAEDVCQISGKVLFSSSASVERVTNLKAAERLFLLLKQDSPLRLSVHTSPAKVSSVLQSRLLSDRNQWTRAVMTWSRLQGELAASRITEKDSSVPIGAKRKIQEKRGVEEQEKEMCLVEFRKHAQEPRENKRLRIDERNHIWTQQNDREVKEDSGIPDVSVVNDVEKRESPEKDKTKDGEKNGANVQDSEFDRLTKRMEPNTGSCSRKMNDLGVNFSSQNMENVTFRINCKCSGSLSRCFGAQEVNKVMGAGLCRLLGWKSDLKNPQLEINVYLSDDYCLLGIPLTSTPLATRSYIKTTGLRATIAWAMASLAQIQPGSCVVDPMCGVGTILIEAAQEHEAACFLGVDNDDAQLQKASENMDFAKLGSRVHLLKASSEVLPLPSASVDAVICDMPFGRKFDTKINMAAKLPLILCEMERVLCVGGTLVVLLSPQLSALLKKLMIEKHIDPTSKQEAKPQTEIQNCHFSSAEHQIFQNHLSAKSSFTGEREFKLSSLKHQTTLRVSLGAIDGLIHKYVKIQI